jgi:hypothetical protein
MKSGREVMGIDGRSFQEATTQSLEIKTGLGADGRIYQL